MKIALKSNYLILLAASGGLVLSSCVTPPPSQPTEPEKPVETVEKPEPKPQYMQIALREADIIGQKIWMNEGSAKVENLLSWNKGENFASLGIGHFIWYPEGVEGPYQETFPALLAFLQEKGLQVPKWLQNNPDVPWKTFEAFNFYKNSPQMVDLRTLMVNSIPQQVQFLLKRLEQALPKMLNSLPTEQQRNRVFQQFYQVTNAPNGVYALVDYVNFKGEGIDPKERYNGLGWGLLQVLEDMPSQSSNVMAEFARSAERTLRRRIQNSPVQRNESRWFDGWKNRIKTYTY